MGCDFADMLSPQQIFARGSVMEFAWLIRPQEEWCLTNPLDRAARAQCDTAGGTRQEEYCV